MSRKERFYSLVGLCVIFAVVSVIAIVFSDENTESTKQEEVEQENLSTPEPFIARGYRKYFPKEVKASEEEIDMLTQRMAVEGSTEEEMLLIGAVILNRVESDKFPNTIKDVLSQPGQFSPIKPIEDYEKVYRTAYAIALDLILNKYRPIDKDVLMYRSAEYMENNPMFRKDAVYNTENVYFFDLH